MNRQLFLTLCLALAALVVAPWAASAQIQVCDDNTRAAFVAAVESGATDADLEAQFGQCRTYEAEPICTVAPEATTSGSGLSAIFEEVKFVTNYNTYYERMNSCGYHPQAEMVACDVEIKKSFGYGGYPAGSFEHVLFCFDCNLDGVFEFLTWGFVHVTDNIAPAPKPSWFHLAFASTYQPFPGCTANNGGQSNVRAILSWVAKPTHCGYKPYWGNRIDFTARRDP